MIRPFVASLFSLVFALPTCAQPGARQQSQTKKVESGRSADADLTKAQQRAVMIAAVVSLADEARGYRDLAVRARVLARAADVLWDADSITARAIFRSAWEAAEKGDAEEGTAPNTTGNPPAMVVALRRVSGHDLRSEVLPLAARRDGALGEEFLAKLRGDEKQETEDAKADLSRDNWSNSEAASKRLQLARKLLDDGEVQRALEIAAPALARVSAGSILFLSALRKKNPAAADERYSMLLSAPGLDPSADANTVSGLSSYVLTPSVYIIFTPDGGSRWSEDAPAPPPALPAGLRAKFFEVAAGILLRPLSPPEQDATSAGRAGKYMVIKRLLPFFERFAPQSVVPLNAQLSILSAGPTRGMQNDNSSVVAQGLQPEEAAGSALEKMQGQLDFARGTRERDLIYADVAVALANEGDARSQDLADKIDETGRRNQVRQCVDLKLIQFALRKKNASEAVRLAQKGQLSHSQRAWAYLQAAKLSMETRRPGALELLDGAADEARRIESDDERAMLLAGVAKQLVLAEPARAWVMAGEVAKAANAAEAFTGERVQLNFPLMTKNGLQFVTIGGADLSLPGLLQSLAKDDFYRSIDFANSLKNEALRAGAILAIAKTALGDRKG
ncbi:MAG TPA: hypothetical protein VF588_07770 [Pyrinomonadaceae bacterium]|jgi:hypothetical protein